MGALTGPTLRNIWTIQVSELLATPQDAFSHP